jgi:predicted molibdopterin-dependent oxidoreductase YjgC
VLPGASFIKKSGTFTNGERRVQRVNEVIPPLAGAKTDGQIAVDIECDFPALVPCEWRVLRFTAQ